MSGHEISELQAKGRLYVVATPIGNLDDLSPRACATLKACDWIYAEDTRTSAVLLKHYGIGSTARPLHDHNEAQATAEALGRLLEGKDVALISDAGTPAISDPGARLVREAQQAGIEVYAVPGPCAAIAALSISGFEGPFLFLGFLPPKPTVRRKALEGWREFPHQLVLYEAPHRILECVADIAEVLGAERELTVARELTKRYEQAHRGGAAGTLAWLQADTDRQRGEFVIVIGGAAPASEERDAAAERVLSILLEELPLKQAAKLAASISGARKNDLYQIALEWGKIRGAGESPKDDDE
jgi:16S rRNA (cytidine1402-2'-O)-methyltransferase